MNQQKRWTNICHKSALIKHSGICALLENNQQVAIFKVDDEQVFTISNWDPIGKANVLYRGIIGDYKGDVYVASPLYKQRFLLSDGHCLDNDEVNVMSYSTRIYEDQLQITL